MKKGSNQPETQRVKHTVRHPEQDKWTILKKIPKLRKIKSSIGKRDH